MEIIVGKRQSGKTYELIKKSANKNGIIICTTKRDKNKIILYASKLKIDINQPLLLSDFLEEKLQGMHNEKFHIDNIISFMQCFFSRFGTIESVSLNLNADDQITIPDQNKLNSEKNINRKLINSKI